MDCRLFTKGIQKIDPRVYVKVYENMNKDISLALVDASGAEVIALLGYINDKGLTLTTLSQFTVEQYNIPVDAKYRFLVTNFNDLFRDH